MMRALELALIAFWFLFAARTIWTVWLKKFLIKEGILSDPSKQSNDQQPPTGE